jgi:hypothetical protein
MIFQTLHNAFDTLLNKLWWKNVVVPNNKHHIECQKSKWGNERNCLKCQYLSIKTILLAKLLSKMFGFGRPSK